MPNSNPNARAQAPPNDLTITCCEVRDQAAARRSAEVDAALDKQWFIDHPREFERYRTASCDEVQAFGCKVGSVVLVRRGPYGSQIRMIQKN
jgi:hypothetical protein